MNFFTDINNFSEINTQTALIRLLGAFIAGAIIGLEREAQRQPAGLKTHILIAVGSNLIMLLSIFMAQKYTTFGNTDPSRIAAQVVSGIGFIGAGAILRMGINVRGLTTAASIWAIAAIGLTIGAGMYIVAAIAVLIILFVLIIVEQLERRFFTPLSLKMLTVKTSKSTSDKTINQLLHQKHLRIIDVNNSFHHKKKFVFTYKIGTRSNVNWIELCDELIQLDRSIKEAKLHDPNN
ncbi:MAG: MgtC/SapB family protein [Prolixibacteraceae bacterium]|nr:MgtC/SapB family protein [Prolixibacteraceae bacterium]